MPGVGASTQPRASLLATARRLCWSARCTLTRRVTGRSSGERCCGVRLRRALQSVAAWAVCDGTGTTDPSRNTDQGV